MIHALTYKHLDMHENQEEKSLYVKYIESGGILNEQDFYRILKKNVDISKEDAELNKQTELQAEEMAKFAGIEHGADHAIELYGIMRHDDKPENAQYHHSQMSDQSLFAEALRMSGNIDSLNKFIEAYHKEGTHCPICLKVPHPGETCR